MWLPAGDKGESLKLTVVLINFAQGICLLFSIWFLEME